MPIPANISGTPMLGFSSPTEFFIGFGSSVFPMRGLGWSMKDSPAFATMKAVSAAGRDIRVPLYQNPLHGFQLVFNFLENDPTLNLPDNPDTDFRMLYSFYSAMTGGYGDFLYQPRESVVTGQALLNPDSNGYVELVYGNGPFFNESIQELNGANPTIFLTSGSPPTTTDITSTCTFYAPDTISPYSGIVFTTSSSVGVGDVLTANYTFYWRVHFDKDSYTFEEFVYDVYKTGVGLSQVRV